MESKSQILMKGQDWQIFLRKKAIDLARKSHQAKPLSLVTFVKRPMLKNEASVSIHQLEDRRPFLRRNSKHIARTSTLGDQTMAFFKSEEIITEWLSEQLTAEINTAGNFSQNLSIQGNLNEFHIFHKTNYYTLGYYWRNRYHSFRKDRKW